MSVDPEYTVLRMAFKNSTLEEIKRVLSETLDDKRANALIGSLKSQGLIDVINITTEEYENCLQWASTDRRVKNPEEYCLRRYPMRIVVKITDAGVIKLIDKAYQHYARFISPLLACVEVTREFKQWIGNGVMVYDVDNSTCQLATELINRELYLRVKDYPRWEGIPLVIVYHRRRTYNPSRPLNNRPGPV